METHRTKLNHKIKEQSKNMTNLNKKYDDLVKCPICFDLYSAKTEDTPRTLRCGHSICFGDVKKLLETGNGGVKCPTCKTISHYTANNLPKKNFTIVHMLEAIKE